MGVGTTRDSRGVALRKESVDRNAADDLDVHRCKVALRKESVDRNLYCDTDSVKYLGRSPQGERG